MKKLILVIGIFAIAFVSCKKNNEDTSICKTAMVHDGGDPAADGLGWILVTDTASYTYEAPENLDASFKTEGLLVDFCYVLSANDFICLCPPPVKKKVIITSIKKR
jgi:hypothetical protein